MVGVEDIITYVPFQYILYDILVLAGVVMIMMKVVPKVSNWFEAARAKTNAYEAICKAVERNTRDIEMLSQKVDSDFVQITQVIKINSTQQKFIEESLEERELILRSLLGVIKGLQEIGANGPTKVAEAEIQAYLLKKLHETSKVGENNER